MRIGPLLLTLHCIVRVAAGDTVARTGGRPTRATIIGEITSRN